MSLPLNMILKQTLEDRSFPLTNSHHILPANPI